jgi:hypothetical protein
MPQDRTAATVCVEYRYMEGYHVFTSDDVYGLYVASRDAQEAFSNVAPAIKLLVKLNEEIDCVVEPAASFREFLETVRKPPSETAHPRALRSQSFVLRAAA